MPIRIIRKPTTKEPPVEAATITAPEVVVTDLNWQGQALASLTAFAKVTTLFTVEDFRQSAMAKGLPAPMHYNQWGPLLSLGALRGLINKTDGKLPSAAKSANGRKITVWESKVFGQA